MVLPNQANYEVDFDTRVGVLSAGEMIYVALGPNGSASADGFAWDFTIAAMAVPEPSSLGLALPLLLGLVPWRRRRR
jgi:MYXO-CTERM domain-containing protein